MPLPVTITGINTTVTPQGPFKSSGGNFYFVAVDSTNNYTLDVYKATDPTDSWSQISTLNITSNRSISVLKVFRVGDDIHIACACPNATNTDYYYHVYSMSSETFSVSNEAIQTGVNSAQVRDIDIAIRSDGDVIVLYDGLVETSMGTDYNRVRYARRESGVWTTAIQVDAGGALSFTTDGVAIGASDLVHLFYSQSTNRYQRALNASNVLQTEGLVGNLSSSFSNAISYTSDGVVRLLVNYVTNIRRGQSGDTVTWSSSSIASVTSPSRLYHDGQRARILYRVNDFVGDDFIYEARSASDGDVWSSGVQVTTYNVQNALNNLSNRAEVYRRGDLTVIPFIIDNDGTMKYDEATINLRTFVFSPYRLLPYLVR